MPGSGSLATALAAAPVVLDGGLSNQLEAAGHDIADALWTARLLRDDPQAIINAHAAYLAAGANVITTASYQATFPGFARAGIDEHETARLLRRSVALGRAAVARASTERELWVAASVGPYGAMLADGSEYRGRYGLTVAELVRFHRPRLAALAQAQPDVLALETVPDTDEAEALLVAAGDLGLPAWLSYTISGDTTRAGQPLAEAFELAAAADWLIAVGVNCCAPADVDAAIDVAARVTGKPVVIYPNSGEQWDSAGRRWRGGSTFPPERTSRWAAKGARLIGGCCRVGPRQIAAVAAALREGLTALPGLRY